MLAVDLGNGTVASRIGYGCGSLMARTSRKESVRLMEVAFDAGLTHFDVARSYGYGEAESAVGEFSSGRRDAVTLTTKLGIAAPQRSLALKTAKAAARRLAGVHPRVRASLRARAAGMVVPGRFSVAEARESFETSLQELKTDYVDFLLLHECGPEDLTDELLAYLEDLQAQGKVRRHGVATQRPHALAIVTQSSEHARIVQTPDSPVEEALPEVGSTRWITHSAMSLAGPPIASHLAEPVVATRWRRRIGEDLTETPRLVRYLLAASLARNQSGVVLTSSRTEAHIRQNALVQHDGPDVEQLRSFMGLVDAESTEIAQHGK